MSYDAFIYGMGHLLIFTVCYFAYQAQSDRYLLERHKDSLKNTIREAVTKNGESPAEVYKRLKYLASYHRVKSSTEYTEAVESLLKELTDKHPELNDDNDEEVDAA